MTDPSAPPALAMRPALIEELAGSESVVACSHVDAFRRIDRAQDGRTGWVGIA